MKQKAEPMKTQEPQGERSDVFLENPTFVSDKTARAWAGLSVAEWSSLPDFSKEAVKDEYRGRA